MASLFDTLQAGAQRAGVTARTNKSRKWFQSKIKDLSMPSRRQLLKDDALTRTNREIAGNMYMYFYDPKLKQTLPYYDRFPLTIMVEPAPGGFYGLNLHYLNYNVRARFLDELMDLGPAKSTESTRLRRLRYKLLASTRTYKEFKPCFKHYLTNHIRSPLSRIPMTDWEIAIFLPVEQFKKKSKATIWAESLKIARR
jgi:hypothetical protein